ncbi:hypothetical protein Daus18300_002456 [Diaporthe australafricana]|uniref:Uncharacterized protein n=1 Tax=Diaporthe australafricana TaxID=127596 RepID=A0ABR3XP46_9PEZI
MANESLDDLLRRYEVPADRSSLETVFQDEEQARLLSEWAKSHLVTDTLLTKNELNSYLAIEQNGKADGLAASADLSSVQTLSDQEIIDAIDELNRSTDAINKQTETLRQQQNALSRLITSSGKAGDARSDLEVKRLYEWESSRKALQTDVELISQGLDYRMSELDQGTKEVRRDLTNVVGEALQSDDKLLSSLQKLGWELETEDPEETESVGQLREICARLIKYTVESIRTKLDRTYLESLESVSKPGSENHTTAPKDDLGALQEELESLYSEILPVAQMSVEQQWLEPSLQSLSARSGHGANHAAEAIQYILHCLDHLQDRIGRVSDRVTSFKAHESATDILVATAKAELSAPVTSDNPKRRATVASISSPERRFQPPLADDMMTPAPRRGRSNTKSRRRSSGVSDSPLEQLLGELAISLPEADKEDAGAAIPVQAQAAHLSNILAERTQKAADVADSVQSTFEHTAVAQLAEARVALQLIRDSVLAESPYAEVHLVDPGIESSIGVLAQEVHNVTNRLEGVESEAAALARGRNVSRDEIISRWRRCG